MKFDTLDVLFFVVVFLLFRQWQVLNKCYAATGSGS